MSEATEIQKKPQGLGREIVPLVQEDLNALPIITPEGGMDTVYLWIRSAAFYVKEQVHGMDKVRELLRSGASINYPDLGVEMREDLELRAQLGEAKYGERLRAFNGRDSRVDLYQELLDALNYLRQWQEETEVKR